MFDRATQQSPFQVPSRCQYVQWPPIGSTDRHPRLWTSLFMGSGLVAVPFVLWFGLMAL